MTTIKSLDGFATVVLEGMVAQLNSHNFCFCFALSGCDRERERNGLVVVKMEVVVSEAKGHKILNWKRGDSFLQAILAVETLMGAAQQAALEPLLFPLPLINSFRIFLPFLFSYSQDFSHVFKIIDLSCIATHDMNHLRLFCRMKISHSISVVLLYWFYVFS